MDHPVAKTKARLSCKQSGLAASHLLSSFFLSQIENWVLPETGS
jgi:hypothetical protein